MTQIGIPSATHVPDKQVRRILDPMKQSIDQITGTSGVFLNSAATLAQLKNAGIIDVDGTTVFNPNAATAASLTAISVEATESTFFFVRAVLDGTAGLAVASSPHDLGFTLPSNAIVIYSFIEVLTTFVSATDAATIALGIASDDPSGIKAAIAISDGSNPWDAGFKDAIPDRAAANMTTKTTASRKVQADVAVEDITAGKLNLFLEFVVSN